MLAGLVAACACNHSGADAGAPTKTSAVAPAAGEIKVEVARVAFDENSQAHFVLLRDQGGTRVLPIMVEEPQARAIELAMHGIKPERPLTHDLLRSVIEQTGNRVDYVVISDLRDEVYYAKIVIDHDRYRIDSRPSDAIALAMGAGVPIYVEDKLMQASTGGEAETYGAVPQTGSALGMTVQTLSPDIAPYFSAAAQSGVVVSNVQGMAERAGVERGDVITKVGGQSVKALDDFTGALAKSAKSDVVILTIDRAGSFRTVTLSR